MKVNAIRLILMTLLLSLVAPLSALAATPAEVAAQVREQWAKVRVSYLASVKPYAADPLVPQYTIALDKAGKSLENFLQLKLASPAAAPTTLTPVVDQLI